MRTALLIALALAGPGAAMAAAENAPPLDPPAMIARADADPRRDHEGTYRMTVKAAAKPGVITFLNSDPDYRAPGNVTFSLSAPVTSALAKRLNGPVTERMVGRTIVVKGILRRVAIVNAINQRAHDFNRWAYQVRIDRVDQIVSIDA